MFELIKLENKKEADQANLLDYFRGLSVTHRMLGADAKLEGPVLELPADDEAFEARKHTVALELRSGYITQLVLTIIFTIVCAALVAITVQMGFLNSKTFSEDYSWMPTLLM